MEDKMTEEEKIFGFDPKNIGLRYRAHQVLTEIDEDWPHIPVGSLVVRARDGASNPIDIEAVQIPNCIDTLEDDFDSTYRYYFYRPLESKND